MFSVVCVLIHTWPGSKSLNRAIGRDEYWQVLNNTLHLDSDECDIISYHRLLHGGPTTTSFGVKEIVSLLNSVLCQKIACIMY